MNNVDRKVYESLLTYPSLFHSRFDVFAHFFLTNGNGYKWSEDGTIISAFPSHLVEAFDENTARKEFFEEVDRLLVTRKEWDIDPTADQLLRDDFTRAQLQFRLDHIETIASLKLSYWDTIRTGILDHLSVGWALIFKIPENVTPEWKEAALELLDFILPKYRGRGRKEDENLITALEEVRNTLRPRNPLREALAAQIIAELKNEEKDN